MPITNRHRGRCCAKEIIIASRRTDNHQRHCEPVTDVTGVAISGVAGSKARTFHHASDSHEVVRYFFGMKAPLFVQFILRQLHLFTFWRFPFILERALFGGSRV